MSQQIKCMVVDCPQEPKDYWYIRTDIGMVERVYCYAHALDYRLSDKAVFGDAYIAGSDEGEA